jgi:hypothetical protein
MSWISMMSSNLDRKVHHVVLLRFDEIAVEVDRQNCSPLVSIWKRVTAPFHATLLGPLRE